MRCREALRLSTSYLEGDLPAERASALRGHLRDCDSCRRALDEEATLAAAVRDAAGERPEPPDGWGALWGRIDARLAERERADAARSPWRLWWGTRRAPLLTALGAGAALASFLAIAAQSPGVSPLPRTSEPEGESAPRSAPEPFIERAEREIAGADHHYAEAIEELRALVEKEQGRWSAERRAELESKLAELEERAAEARSRLAVMGVPQPHARDELYAVYREEIGLLQRAAVGAPLTAMAEDRERP